MYAVKAGKKADQYYRHLTTNLLTCYSDKETKILPQLLHKFLASLS